MTETQFAKASRILSKKESTLTRIGVLEETLARLQKIHQVKGFSCDGVLLKLDRAEGLLKDKRHELSIGSFTLINMNILVGAVELQLSKERETLEELNQSFKNL